MSADWLPTVAALADIGLPQNVSTGLMGRDASVLLLGTSTVAPRTTPKMFDYRADGYGYCWNQAPRLAIRDWEPATSHLKLLMNPDRSRVELFNLTASTFEGNNIALAQPEVVERLAARLSEWQETVPQSPLMTATHMGCLEYEFPQAPGDEVAEVTGE